MINKKLFQKSGKNTHKINTIMVKGLFRILLMTALGMLILPISVYFHLPNSFSFSGNLICELFMTIFNIHFFGQIQKK